MLWRVFRPKALDLLNVCHNILVNKHQKMPFYAVAKGRTPGIYMTWADCESQVKGYSGARYKKFDSVTAAQEYVTTIGSNATSQKPKSTNSRQSLPNTSQNLKRNFSTSSNNNPNNKNVIKKAKSTHPESEDEMSDLDDDLSTILTKQMDDIEARVKSFGKGLDNIIKKSTTSNSKKAILIEPVTRQVKRQNYDEFEVDGDGYVHVYTDGACSSNGRKGARAGLGVYWGDGHSLNTSAPVSGRATNNCGEIQAATQAIKIALSNGVDKLVINTDSKFLINSVTKWMPGWKRKGWKLKSGEPVKNEDDFKELDELQDKLVIKWNYVEAHKGLHGNEMADQLAKAGAAMYNKRI